MSREDEDSLREEPDFSGGVRGKHHDACRQGTNVVLSERDEAEVFRDCAAVNRA